jgi:hypothetical protein
MILLKTNLKFHPLNALQDPKAFLFLKRVEENNQSLSVFIHNLSQL